MNPIIQQDLLRLAIGGYKGKISLRDLLYLLAFALIFLGIIIMDTRPTEAEYHHCMVTSTDKSICESLKPQ